MRAALPSIGGAHGYKCRALSQGVPAIIRPMQKVYRDSSSPKTAL